MRHRLAVADTDQWLDTLGEDDRARTVGLDDLTGRLQRPV